MRHEKISVMGMELEEWSYRSCIAHFAEFKKTATLYDIRSKEQGKGHAYKLMTEAKKYYEKQGKKVGGSVALNDKMSKLYKELNYKEYK